MSRSHVPTTYTPLNVDKPADCATCATLKAEMDRLREELTRLRRKAMPLIERGFDGRRFGAYGA